MQLLTALQERPEGWTFDPLQLEQALDAVAEALRGPDVALVIRQYFGVIGLLVEKLNRVDLAQQLVNGLEPRLDEGHQSYIRGLLAEQNAERLDVAQANFEKFSGTAPAASEPELPSSGKKLDFSLPKGRIKG